MNIQDIFKFLNSDIFIEKLEHLTGIKDLITNNITLKIKSEKIRSLKILNMKKNKGHARCNASFDLHSKRQDALG